MAIDTFLKLGDVQGNTRKLQEEVSLIDDDLADLVGFVTDTQEIDSFKFRFLDVKAGNDAFGKEIDVLSWSWSSPNPLSDTDASVPEKIAAARAEAALLEVSLDELFEDLDVRVKVTGGGNADFVKFDLTDVLVSSYNTGPRDHASAPLDTTVVDDFFL